MKVCPACAAILPRLELTRQAPAEGMPDVTTALRICKACGWTDERYEPEDDD